MKKNKTLLIILALLIVSTAYFIYQSSNTTIKKELSDFAVKDTAAITKIFLADRNGNTILLEREKNSQWILNGKDEPKSEFLNLFMAGIYQIDVRNKVAKAAYNNVIKALATSAIKCEIYLNNETKPFKTYYVGTQTEDDLGTFMILENSSVPFVTEIPGFNGYLTPRYSVKIDAWKKNIVFQIPPEKIKTLSITYTNFPEKSFKIHSENGRYAVESPFTKTTIPKVDSVAIDNYLANFRSVYYEAVDRSLRKETIDSLLLQPPSIIVELTDVENKTKSISIYPMPLNEASITREDSTGKPLKYDLDKMYGFTKPSNEILILQHYTFDVLFRQLFDFNLQKRDFLNGAK